MKYLICYKTILTSRFYSRYLHFFLVIFIASEHFQCSSPNRVKVIGKNFTDEISLTQNLVFTLNKDLVPESHLGSWDSTQYIQFEPAIKGRFKWTATNEVVFSPLNPLDPATQYNAKLTKNLLKHNPEASRYDIDRESVPFNTPLLQVTEIERWWTRSKESGRPEARIKLNFNYPVHSKTAGLLKLTLKNQPLGFKVIPSQDNRSIQLSINPGGEVDESEIPISILLEKGVQIDNSNYTSPEPIEFKSELPSPLTLEVSDIKTGFENNKGFVRIITTQELAEEHLDTGFSIDPAVLSTAEKTENGFIVRGDFTETDTYVLKLNQTLKGILGPSLKEENSSDLFFGKMPSGIAFTDKKSIYLTPKGSKNIGVQIVNVPQVQVKIQKLYENNILSYLRNGRYENYAEIGDEWKPNGTFNYSDDQEALYSDVIVNKTIDTENLARNKGVSALNIAIPDHNDRQGVYLVSVHSKEQAWLGQTKLVSVSDIGLIAKEGQNELWVFANSIKSTESLANVEINLISSNNQPIASVRTDDKGVARFEKLDEQAPGFRVALITATKEKDFNYLLLGDTRVETSRFEVEGSRDNVSALQAFIYGERDIYRPGETAHFNTVIRLADWQPAREIPVKIRLLTPNGREFGSWRKKTNEQGAVETEVTIDAAAMTGVYIFEVYNANDVLLSSQNINVEEFIPDRIKVDLGGAKPDYSTGETVQLTATALNLFGPPAANRNYEMEVQLKRKKFFARNYPEFSFEIPSESSFEKIQRHGITNDRGEASEKFQLPAQYKDIGVLEGKIYVTVFDENGRPVNRLQQFDVYTQNTFYGVRLPESYVGVNRPLPIEIIGTDKAGQLKPGVKGSIEVVRIEYQTIVEKQGEQLHYTSRKKEKTVYSSQLTLEKGKGTFRYTPTLSGEYEIRVKHPDAVPYTATSFYAYGQGFTEYSSFEVSREGRVLMNMDKTQYKVGDKVKILFKTPFEGRLLVTLERNKLMEYHVLETSNRAAELSIKLTQNNIPNVYVTATLIRPLDNSTLPLTVAHGFQSIPVDAPSSKLSVVLTTQKHTRSKTRQRITVKSEPNAQVTLSVVDEGILQIRNFRTPDIHGFFYQKKALEVASHDLYALLFPELNIGTASSTGGDGYNLERRINPLSNGRQELVRFWSGIIKTNKSGEATFDIDIPQFSGDLRIMAVAYKDKALGSASEHMKVADPVVISVGSPRFMSPGDELILPVNVSNNEKTAAKTVVSCELSGPLTAQTVLTPTSLSILSGKEQRTYFKIKALPTLGEGKIKVLVKTSGETFVHETRLQIRPASPLLKTSASGVIAGGQNAAISLATNFLPATAHAKVVFSRSPLVQGGGKALSTLLGYPHGCLEQTVSKAFPQLYFADLAQAMASQVYLVRSGDSDFNPVTTVQQAIRKAESMQLFNGGFGMWPGVAREDWWVSAYTVHFLYEAQRAGFDINANAFSKAQDYLTAKSNNRATEEVSVTPSEDTPNHTTKKVMAQRESIYSLYVLALTGKPNRPAMNYYKQNESLLSNDSRYLLAAAFQISGETRSAGELMPKIYSVAREGLDNGSLSSPLRNLALVLNTLIEADPNHLQIPVIARQLSQAVQTASYLNTQEAAFVVLALGKVAKKTAKSEVVAGIELNGKKIGNFTGKELSLSKGLINQKLMVKTVGKGDLYWFSQTEGMSATGNYTEEDQGLRIRRQFLSRDGKIVKKIRQNDLIVVKLTLSSTNGLPIQNVVITDILPACFEVENPRITEPREMPWIKGAATPEYFDIRDDRIHYFTNATGKEKSFYYQVRVTAKGNFVAGPASADAMYQGEYRSYSDGRKITAE